MRQIWEKVTPSISNLVLFLVKWERFIYDPTCVLEFHVINLFFQLCYSMRLAGSKAFDFYLRCYHCAFSLPGRLSWAKMKKSRWYVTVFPEKGGWILSHLEVRKREFDGKEHRLARNEVNEKKNSKLQTLKQVTKAIFFIVPKLSQTHNICLPSPLRTLLIRVILTVWRRLLWMVMGYCLGH